MDARENADAESPEPPLSEEIPSSTSHGNSVCPFMEMKERGLRQMVAACNFTSEDCVFDLGCGTGVILGAVLAAFPCSGVGVELNVSLARQAQKNLKRFASRTRFIVDDVRNVDLSEATAVTCYFLTHSFAFLAEHLSTNLKPGCRVLNYTYPMPGWLHAEPPINGVHIYVIGQHL